MCPMCAKSIGLGALTARRWVAALVQIALCTAFMLIFHFPRFMIVIFGAMILVATALSGLMKSKFVSSSSTPQRPVAHPTLFRILSLGVAVSSITFFAILLFGFVIFMNAFSSWQQYEGKSYHRADFEVTRVYFQRGSKGGITVYASGTVDGQREWMGLIPYLHTRPRNQAEADEQVPVGTSIPIYLFPDLKGQARVRIVGAVPPAEGYHRTAMDALKNSLEGLALAGVLIFVLLRLRAACFAKDEAAFAAHA